MSYSESNTVECFISRLDYNHCASRLAQEKFRIKDPDYYDFESKPL